jgi:hypothetical protein
MGSVDSSISIIILECCGGCSGRRYEIRAWCERRSQQSADMHSSALRRCSLIVFDPSHWLGGCIDGSARELGIRDFCYRRFKVDFVRSDKPATEVTVGKNADRLSQK